MNAGPEGKCVCNFLHSCQRGVRAGLGGARGQKPGPRGSPVPGSDLASTQPWVAGCGTQGRAGPWPPAQELPGGASGLVWLGDVRCLSHLLGYVCAHPVDPLYQETWRGRLGYWVAGCRSGRALLNWSGCPGSDRCAETVVLGVTATVSLGGGWKGGRGRWGVGGRTRCPRGYCGRRTQGGERCPAGLQP